MKTALQILVALAIGAIILGSKVAFVNDGINQRKTGQDQGYTTGWQAGSNAVRYQQLFKIVDTQMDDWFLGWMAAKEAYAHQVRYVTEDAFKAGVYSGYAYVKLGLTTNISAQASPETGHLLTEEVWSDFQGFKTHNLSAITNSITK